MDNGTTSSSSSSISSTNGQDHPLQQPWQLYLHYPTVTQALESYGKEAYQALCEFSTVEGFWTYFHHLPKPSDVFTEMVPGSQPAQLSRRKLDGKNLEAFGLFKKGVKPEWEDALNLKGGHWECRRDFDLPSLDRMWTSTVLALIGETLEDGSVITGARVVDKCKFKRAEYRLELWTSTKEAGVNDEIRERLREAMKEGLVEGGMEAGVVPDFVWKDHSESVVTAGEGYGGSTTSLSVSTGREGGGGGGAGGGEGRGASGLSSAMRDKVFGKVKA